MTRNIQRKILFITGTDTGVGKTLLTALLLAHLRSRGHNAIALKPFCSGTRADAELLHSLQDGDLTLDEVNPFYFHEPVAPLVSARKHRRRIPLPSVLSRMGSVLSHHSPPIKNQKSKIKNLLCLIEGSGGLLVPLGKGYTVLDLITSLKCEVVVVARNRLGTINHTLLTIRALQAAGVKKPSVALMDCKQPDISSRSNYRILSQLLAPVSVHPVPFLTARRFNAWAIKKSALKLGRELSRFLLE